MGKSEKANMKGEEYLKGRKAGVEKTYGETRGSKHSAEKTLLPHSDVNDGGGESELSRAARSIYQDAVHNRGDKDGDKALTER
jgi:hypothetical protein